MHEKLQNDIPLKEDIHDLMRQCLKTEKDLGLAEKTIKELSRYLNEFVVYCKNQSIHTVEDLTPDFLKSYAEQRSATGGPKLKKAVVWSLRKFGKHLALLQALEEDPARNLRHPTFHPRAEVPEYLSEQELRRLLQYAAHNLNLRDFAIISLVSTTGLRPNEVATCRRSDFFPKQGTLYVHVKGGWIKQTPLSETMTAILTQYLATRHDRCQALFVNKRGGFISVDWLQRMIKTIGEKAGLTLTCNHLRHTFATFAAETSGKVITKALMGHQRLATTEVYTHLSPRYFKSLMMLHPYLKATKKGAFHEHR
jgi:site-specific recombinase XerD